MSDAVMSADYSAIVSSTIQEHKGEAKLFAGIFEGIFLAAIKYVIIYQ
jgi:hypothetical protein